jgi:integrase
MPRIHLTDLSIRALKHGDTPITLYDQALRCFGVRVTKTTKTFLVMRGRERKRITIGHWPECTLKGARDTARRLLLETDQAPTATFGSVFDTYLETYIKPNYKPRSAQEAERLLRKHAAPLFPRSLASITTTDCTEIFDELLETPGEANHFFGVLRTFFSWCETRNYLPDSPLRKLPKPSKTHSRKRVLMPNEIAAIWRTATELNHPYGHLIKLLLWTGQRRGEIAAFRRSFINPVERTATLPSGLTKNGLEHVFVLGDEALAYLNALPGNTDLFFPVKHASDVPINGWGKWKIAFDKQCLSIGPGSSPLIWSAIGTPELRSVAQQRRASTRGSKFGADERVRRWPIHRPAASVPVLEAPAIVASLDDVAVVCELIEESGGHLWVLAA